MTIRVLLADDQAVVRYGLRLILESEPDLELAGEASDGEAAVAAVGRLRPDVVLMDIRMPRLDEIAALRRIVASGAPTRALMLTTFDLDEYGSSPIHVRLSHPRACCSSRDDVAILGWTCYFRMFRQLSAV